MTSYLSSQQTMKILFHQLQQSRHRISKQGFRGFCYSLQLMIILIKLIIKDRISFTQGNNQQKFMLDSNRCKATNLNCYYGYLQQIIKYQGQNKMASQAIFDICLTIGSIRNLCKEWSPRFSFRIYFQIAGSQDQPCPYSLVQNSNNKWKSTIGLNCYQSDSVLLGPFQEKQIIDNCLWRSSISLTRIEDLQLFCVVEFLIDNNTLGSAKFNYSSCVGVCSFLPIFSPGLGVAISAAIQTQMLGIRVHKNSGQDRLPILYKGLQNLFNQSNRLTHKLKCLQNTRQENKTIESMSSISGTKQYKDESEQVNEYQAIYREYEKLKQFKASKIFRYQLTKEHRHDVYSFLTKIRGQFSKKLQLNWQQYLKLSIIDSCKKIDELRANFVVDFAYEIKNKIIRNKSLEKSKVCSFLMGQLKSKIEGFQLTQVYQQKMQLNQESYMSQSLSFLKEDRKIVVLVHGLGANSSGMTYIERTIRYLYPSIDILNSISNQYIQENIDLDAMGRNLAIQLLEYVKKYDANEDLEISFIAHSLGGLVVRAALPYLNVLKHCMNSFITMATPHLGHIEHSNKIAKFGMVALNAIEKSKVIDNLLLRDNKNPRLSVMYNLSTHSSLSWFKQIVFYGSEDDGYVSANSALVYYSEKQGYFHSKNQIMSEMSKNINEVINSTRVSKFNIKFEHEANGYKPDIGELILGRSSHLAFPCNQSFINLMILQNHRNFKEEQRNFSQQCG